MFKQIAVLSILISFQLSASANQCPANETWVSPHPRSEYEKQTGVHYSAADVIGYCRSKGRAYEYWPELFSNEKIDGWPHHKEKFKPWTSDEIAIVLRELSRIPEFFWKKMTIYRAVKSETDHNTATSADEIIVLYDEAFEHKSELARYLVHELAHEFYRRYSIHERDEYFHVAHWVKSQDNPNNAKLDSAKRSFVASDGDLSPGEDFANNIEYWLFEPFKLKVKSPEIRDWLEIEYGDKIKKKRKEK